MNHRNNLRLERIARWFCRSQKRVTSQRKRINGWLLLVLLIDPSIIFGQVNDSTVVRYFLDHQYELRIVNGRLEGSAVAWLLHEAGQTQFLFIGEEHDQQPIPQLLSALWPNLLSLGYRHVALETGQWLGNRLDRYVRFDDEGALNQFKAASWPRRPTVSVPPVSEEDIDFFTVIRQNRPAKNRAAIIWGLDHEFKVTPLLERLTALSLPASAHKLLPQILNQVKTAESGGRYTMQPYKASLQSLIRSLDSKEGHEKHFIADALQRRIWGVRNDQERNDVMKQLFLRNYRMAQRLGTHSPKVLLRFGSYHAKRGLMTTYGSSTLANFVAELAYSEGATLLTVKVVCCAPTDTAQAPRPCTPAERVWLAPMAKAAAYHWTLFDLRPLRNDLASGNYVVSPELAEVTQGYDAILLLDQYIPSHLPEVVHK